VRPDLGRTLERDAEVFVSLIARNLRLVLTQTSRELTLRDAFLFDVAMYSYCAM
jgi:hypothetical protein